MSYFGIGFFSLCRAVLDIEHSHSFNWFSYVRQSVPEGFAGRLQNPCPCDPIVLASNRMPRIALKHHLKVMATSLGLADTDLRQLLTQGLNLGANCCASKLAPYFSFMQTTKCILSKIYLWRNGLSISDQLDNASTEKCYACRSHHYNSIDAVERMDTLHRQ